LQRLPVNGFGVCIATDFCLLLGSEVEYFYFQKRRDFFYFNFIWEGKVEALLQALDCAWACAPCKCAYTCELA
jgi:hypothetical protein